jgi:hypothetical protein
MEENRRSSISHATTLEDMGAFWDTHDLTEYDTDAPDVAFTFRRTIAIEMNLYEAIEKEAQARGVSPETLINLWLQQKLSDKHQQVAA